MARRSPLPWLALPLLALLGLACDDTGEESGQTTGSEESAGETEAEACAERPVFPELYSSCAGAAHCGESGNACASQTGQDPVYNQAFCTKSCYMDADCPAVGDCSATPVCIAPAGGQGVCALDCDEGRQCPSNMMCLSDLDPENPRNLCF